MFKSSDERSQAILDELQGLSREVAELRGEHDALDARREELQESIDLRQEIETLKIERDRLTETHDREVREVKHMVGLEKKRAEFEKESAIREAKLAVREEAADDKITAFTEKLEFIEEQFSKQIAYLKDDIIKQVLKRLPVVEVNKHLTFEAAGSGNAERVEA